MVLGHALLHDFPTVEMQYVMYKILHLYFLKRKRPACHLAVHHKALISVNIMNYSVTR